MIVVSSRLVTCAVKRVVNAENLSKESESENEEKRERVCVWWRGGMGLI